MPPPRVFAALGLFVRERFLSPEECASLAASMIAGKGEPAQVFGDGLNGDVDTDVRRAWEVDVPDQQTAFVDARVRALVAEIERHFDVQLDPPDSASFLRYPPGAFYRVHHDRRDPPDPTGGDRRAVSLVLFVNGHAGAPPFRGGHLRFYGLLGEDGLADIGLDAEPESGTLIAFRSTIEHEVTTVEEGVRCTIVTWFNERVRAGAT